MSNKIQKGLLKHWNEDKGFGFIIPETGKRDIFIHISALKKMSRRPVVGDTIYYEIYTNGKGKTKAVNAQIEGVKPIAPKVEQNPTQTKTNWLLYSILVIVILVVGVVSYQAMSSHELKNQSLDETPINQTLPTSPISTEQDFTKNYSCDGRQHCSEMTSCEEAKFFINNCPDTKMDSDGDDIPCESQWCY